MVAQPKIYLLSGSALDRRAMSLLFEHEVGKAIHLSSNFVPTSIWDALRHKPDLIIVDCNQPTSQVVDAVQMIQRLQPDARIVVLSAAGEPVTVHA
ncbi:MAG: hypothetical protein AB7N71_09620, partial [Phycisphaerae bacterium]